MARGEQSNSQIVDERSANTAAAGACAAQTGGNQAKLPQRDTPASPVTKRRARTPFVACACAAAVLLVVSVGALVHYAQESDVPESAELARTAAQSTSHPDSATSSDSSSSDSGELDGADSSSSAGGVIDTGNASGSSDVNAASDANGQSASFQGSSAAATSNKMDASSNNQSSGGTQSSEGSGNSAASSGSSDSAAPSQGAESGTINVTITVDGTAAGSNAASGTVSIPRGGTPYDALVASGASVNAHPTTFGMYVAAINGLAEKEHGAMSGWLYSINGTEPQIACDQISLSDGDSVVWRYSTG